MELTSQMIEEEKTLLFTGDVVGQTARITIRFVNDEGLKKTGYWEFVNCKFTTEKQIYTLSDWEFLEAINKKINKLIK